MIFDSLMYAAVIAVIIETFVVLKLLNCCQSHKNHKRK